MSKDTEVQHVPLVNVRPLVSGEGDRTRVADEIARACREWGFFYVTGHGVDDALQRRLEESSRRFFAQDLETKMAIRMERGGPAWRGYFPVGGELTSGKPDVKEGLYFGAELTEDHPLVADGTPLHGRNLFPSGIPELRDAVLGYMNAMTRLGHALMEGIALSLGLESTYFADRYTSDPLVLFRIFNYPGDPSAPGVEPRWGVGEHTDYGLLTILKQNTLLESNPALARTIRDRFPYIDPLNHVQIELLKRYRAGDADEGVVQGIHLTINGIAAGLRNSG